MATHRIIIGNCVERMAGLPEASVDAIVTDPPYGLSFMGKAWDHGVPGEPFWREALRVAKPGAHLLAFGGTRTHHRLMVAIEDAGWEIRDCVMWVYGSGFPKSLDVSKAIERVELGTDPIVLSPEENRFCQWMRDCSGLTEQQAIRLFSSPRFLSGSVEIVNTATPERPRMGRRAMVPTASAWENAKPEMQQPPPWVEALVKNPPKPAMQTPSEWKGGRGQGTRGGETEAAKQWSGWGTALKPAWEPIIVARKPLIGTVAANVQTFGTGAINVDRCRVKGAPEPTRFDPSKHSHDGWRMTATGAHCAESASPLGRWPANLIHDGSEEVVGLFPQTTSGANPTRRGSPKFRAAYGEFRGQEECERVRGVDSGSAARFFYCAKASKKDRELGLTDTAPLMAAADMVDRTEGSDGMNSPRAGAGRTSGSKNGHPTVKPTALMRYLCRLITPPGGVVLDPFCGSGSTGVAAILEGFDFIGIDSEPQWAEVARQRCEGVSVA